MRRRQFLTTGLIAAGATASSVARGTGPNDRIRVCVMGVRGRGGALLNEFAGQEDVDVTYVCDVDEGILTARVDGVVDRTGRRPQAIGDFRRAIDDPNVDALVIGTPDHWHALPSIYACQAGKDVYVEKPDGHNVREGQVMVAAQRRHRRVVQLGTQARSGSFQHAAMEYLAEGHLGRVRFAKAWESARQRSLGHPPDGTPPPGVDYDAWLGPAPERAFNPLRFHGNWRWFFDYGSGDLGNDGVHRLDVARWALGTALRAQGETLPRHPYRRFCARGQTLLRRCAGVAGQLDGHLQLSPGSADL